MRGDAVDISIEIDKFTPCLIQKSDGKIINTDYSIASANELKNLKSKGWNFNWRSKDLSNTVIYKLTLENDSEIQGLIALEDYCHDKAIYITLAESAPHNLGANRIYEGVGGHLFAVAAKESLNKGYGVFLFPGAKNMELVDYYHKAFGAILLGMPHPYRMFIDENQSKELLRIYTLKGE